MRKLLAILLISPTICAAAKTADTSPQVMTLSPQMVINRVLLSGLDIQEVRETAKSERLVLYKALGTYDFTLTSDANYQDDRSEKISGFASEKERTLNLGWGLSKKTPVGTTFGLEQKRTSRSEVVNSFFTSSSISSDRRVVDSVTISIEQELWKNSFGFSDRKALESAEAAIKKSDFKELESLENLVVTSMESFWEAYVGKENLKQSLSAKKRLQGLVKTVRNKSRLGYANPGELAQAKAELEEQGQRVKLDSETFLNKLDTLFQIMQVSTKQDVVFDVGELLPAIPNLAPVNVESLRPFRIAQENLRTTKNDLDSTINGNRPKLNLIAKASYTGGDTDPSKSFSEVGSLGHPLYYIGLSFEHKLDSELIEGTVANKRALHSLEEIRLKRSRDTSAIALKVADRRVRSQFQVAESAIRTAKLREKAVKQMERAYKQGRTDISLLIQAYNKLFSTQAAKSRAIGNYHIALNSWAAARDELISPGKTNLIEPKVR